MFLFSSGWAIKCYKCSPDFQSLLSNDKKDCSNPTDTKNCTTVQLGNVSVEADSCLTLSVTLNRPSSGDIPIYFQDCGVKSACTAGTKSLCETVRALVNGTGTELNACDGACCEGDLCNDPSEAPTKPEAPTNTGPAMSHALLGILGLIAVAFENMF